MHFPLIILILFSFICFAPTSALTPQPCYFAPNSLAPDTFLPCYSSTHPSHYACCRAGDKCLENSACYSPSTGVTYQYGCTDSTFNAPQCAQKCHLDTAKSHWVGLVFCNGTKGLPWDEWVCHHPDNCGDVGGCENMVWGDEIQRMPETGCEDIKHGEEYVAFEASWTLSDTAALPVESKTAGWWSENADRWRSGSMTTTGRSTMATMTVTTALRGGFGYPGASPAATTFITVPAATFVTTPSPSPTPQPASNERNYKVSLGVGLGVGLPFVLVILLSIFNALRRHYKRHHQKDPATSIE
jgi:hypothetical protein